MCHNFNTWLLSLICYITLSTPMHSDNNAFNVHSFIYLSIRNGVDKWRTDWTHLRDYGVRAYGSWNLIATASETEMVNNCCSRLEFFGELKSLCPSCSALIRTSLAFYVAPDQSVPIFRVQSNEWKDCRSALWSHSEITVRTRWILLVYRQTKSCHSSLVVYAEKAYMQTF